MNEQNNFSKNAADYMFSIGQFILVLIQEIFFGISKNKVPARMCYFGFVIAALLYFRLDLWLLGFFGLKYALPLGFRNFLIYFSLLSGWVVWAIGQAVARAKLLGKLKNAFDAAKLKCNGIYPSLIEDVAVDNHVRKLRLVCRGVTKSEFEAAIEKLEAILNMSIVRVLQEEGDKSKIEILYTMKSLTTHAVLENAESFVDYDIPIGLSYEGPITVNIRSVAHMLVAGLTGGGKSNFLKLLVSVLVKNNPDVNIVFLDFKGGMESADLKDHLRLMEKANIKFYEGTQSCVDELERVGIELESRFKNFSEVGAISFDDYLKRKVAKDKALAEVQRGSDAKRTFIVVDEIAQLYSKEPGVDKKVVSLARAAVNRVARQGRAAGVHLVAATQKPDSANFDQTVKANLPAILCFPMANQSASVTAIGTKRAFELNPNIKGRAIWKYGPKVEEVQTYLFK